MGNSHMGKHPRILVATDNVRDQINGVAITFKHLAIAAEHAGYEMHFIDPSKFYHFSFPGYKEVKLAIPFGISRQIKEFRPDYIHIATEGPIGLATKLYCDKNNMWYNTSYHTKFPEYIEQLYKIPSKYTYKYMRWFHEHSGVVLTTTTSMKQTLLNNGFTNVKEWTRGVDTANLKKLVRNPSTNKTTVLYVGRVSREKNLEKLLELQDNYSIIIVGDGPDRLRLANKYEKVTFAGYKTGKELFQYYIDADVFCFPSVTDTFGIVLIEALAAGTPVAAYPVTGPIDIIQSGVNGYLGDNLKESIDLCLHLNRDTIKKTSEMWTWKNCWNIFKKYLYKAHE